MATLSGAWQRAQSREAGSGYGRAPADIVDDSHSIPPADNQDSGPDTRMVPPVRMTDLGVLAESAPGAPMMAATPGVGLDNTPWGSHDNPGWPGHSESAWGGHEADAGSADYRRTATPGNRDGETRNFGTVEFEPVSIGSSRQIKYQQTSRPDNLADSRNPTPIMRWVDRRFGYRWRRPDVMPALVRSATVAYDSPVPPDANQYVSPYPTQASGRIRTAMTPQARVIPDPLEQQISPDGTGAPSAPDEYLTWGL